MVLSGNLHPRNWTLNVAFSSMNLTHEAKSLFESLDALGDALAGHMDGMVTCLFWNLKDSTYFEILLFVLHLGLVPHGRQSLR